jgi:molybdenum cofactor cytidylyltransferase
MNNKLAVLILAAGKSSRMGRIKQLLEFDGKTLVQRSIENAINTGIPVIVILGAGKDEIVPTLQGYSVQIVINENWTNGISSSLIAGLHSALSSIPDLDGVLITLADQPHITSSHLKNILGAAKGESKIVTTEYHGTQGVPVYIPKKYFERVGRLTGDVGAQALIKEYSSQVKSIPFPAAAFDIDTEADWKYFSEGSSRE